MSPPAPNVINKKLINRPCGDNNFSHKKMEIAGNGNGRPAVSIQIEFIILKTTTWTRNVEIEMLHCFQVVCPYFITSYYPNFNPGYVVNPFHRSLFISTFLPTLFCVYWLLTAHTPVCPAPPLSVPLSLCLRCWLHSSTGCFVKSPGARNVKMGCKICKLITVKETQQKARTWDETIVCEM